MQFNISRALLLMAFSFLSTIIFAQGVSLFKPAYPLSPGDPGVLSGRVLAKKTGEPVPGASIYIADLKTGVVTDTAGRYTFRSLPGGTYLVEVHSIGFKALTRSVRINGATAADFELTDEYVEESPVVVTGMSRATQIKRSPVPIVAVSHEFLVTSPAANIIDAIAKVPGVNALSTGPNVSKPFIRGLGYNRILTLYDGVRQEGQQWGDEHGVEVDQYGVERVELIKGPSSLSYGSDALAGVVNLVPTQPAPEGKTIGNILAEYETNNGMFGGSAMLGATKKGVEWMGRLSHKQAANYQNRIDGRVYGTAFNETDAAISLGLHRNWGYSHISLSMFDDLQEIPDGSRDSASRKFTKQITEADSVRPMVTSGELRSYSITPLHQHVQHYRLYSTNNFTIGKGRLSVNAGLQRSWRREYNHPQAVTTPGLFLQLNTVSYDVKYFFPEWDGWSLTAGANGMYQDNKVTKGTEFIIPDYHQFDAGPFAMVRRTFGRLDLSGGLRFDSRNFNNSALYTKTDPATGFEKPVYGADTAGAENPFRNYKQSFSGLSGSIGATYNFSEKFSVKANLARGYRAPNISEIASNGVHPGTNIYQIGNPDFKPEFSLQEDIGLAYSSRYVVINFSIFNNALSNYIFNQRVLTSNGADSVVVPGNQTYRFQQGKAQLFGGEFSIDLHPVKALHFENSISAVYGRNKGVDPKLQSDSNRYLPFVPPLHGISELRYNFETNSRRLVNPFVRLQLSWNAAQNRVYLAEGTETATPGYTLWNAGAGIGIANSNGQTIFNLYLAGNNLFDLAYQDHLSRLKYFEPYPGDPRGRYGIYNMGRNFSIKLEFPLAFGSKKQ